MHIYTSRKTGEKLPSVTYIIDKTNPLSETIRFAKAREKKKELKGWNDEDWETHCFNATTRGSMCHAYLEWRLRCFVQDQDQEKEIFSFGDNENWFVISDLSGYQDSIDQWIEDFFYGKKEKVKIEILGIEEVVINEDLFYGGRSDVRLGITEGDKHKVMLIDLKTFAGYESPRTKQFVYHWTLWRSPKKVTAKDPVTQAVRKDLVTRKPLKVKEAMPEVNARGWDWISHWCKGAFLQISLYILAFRDMGIKINEAAILVATPKGYQMIPMPSSIWSGCKAEAVSRAIRFKTESMDKWKLQAAYYSKQENKQNE